MLVETVVKVLKNMKNRCHKTKHHYSKIIDDSLIYSHSREDLYRLENIILKDKIESDDKNKSLSMIKSNQESLINFPIYTDTKSQSMYNNYLYNLISGSLTLDNLELDVFDNNSHDSDNEDKGE